MAAEVAENEFVAAAGLHGLRGGELHVATAAGAVFDDGHGGAALRGDAVVAGRTAAHMHDDTSYYEAPFTFDVPTPKRTTREDVVLRPWPVDESDVITIEGLPVTSVERTTADLVREREDPSLVGNFLTGACSRGHVLDETRLAELLSPLAARNGFAKGDGNAFARKLASDYATDAQVQYALIPFARILQGTEADPETRERFRAAVETMLRDENQNGGRE